MDSNKPEEVVNTKLTNKENIDEEALKVINNYFLFFKLIYYFF